MARKLKHFVVHFWLASPRLNVPLLRLRHWVGKDKNFDIMIWYSALGTRISFFLTIETFFQNQRRLLYFFASSIFMLHYFVPRCGLIPLVFVWPLPMFFYWPIFYSPFLSFFSYLISIRISFFAFSFLLLIFLWIITPIELA